MVLEITTERCDQEFQTLYSVTREMVQMVKEQSSQFKAEVQTSQNKAFGRIKQVKRKKLEGVFQDLLASSPSNENRRILKASSEWPLGPGDWTNGVL